MDLRSDLARELRPSGSKGAAVQSGLWIRLMGDKGKHLNKERVSPLTYNVTGFQKAWAFWLEARLIWDRSAAWFANWIGHGRFSRTRSPYPRHQTSIYIQAVVSSR